MSNISSLIEIAIEPKSKSEQDKLARALIKLAAEDSSFHFSTDAESGQTVIGGMSELHLDTKIDALFCHESQLEETGEWFRDFLRERAEEGGRQAGVRYAEGFRRLAFG